MKGVAVGVVGSGGGWREQRRVVSGGSGGKLKGCGWVQALAPAMAAVWVAGSGATYSASMSPLLLARNAGTYPPNHPPTN